MIAANWKKHYNQGVRIMSTTTVVGTTTSPLQPLLSQNSLRRSSNIEESLRQRFRAPSVANPDSRLVTRYSDAGGRTWTSTQISNEIVNRVSRIYAADAVTVNDTYMILPGTWDASTQRPRSVPCREINIKRTFCMYDLVPFGVFFPTLTNLDSIYRKTIEGTLIRDYVLNAKPNENDVDQIFRNALTTVKNTHPTVDDHNEILKQLIKRKYDEDVDFNLIEEDREGFSRELDPIFEDFLIEFAKRYQEFLMQGRDHLAIAFAKSKSLTLQLPNELYDPIEKRQLGAYIEAPKDSGFATKFAINSAIFLRSGN
jgi:hypothetical protein